MLFTLDGKELISVSDDKTIRVWDATSGEPLRVLRPPVGDDREGMLFAAALSPDGRRLAVGGIGPQADRYGSIYLLSLSDGEIEQVLTGHSRTINDLAFSADGRWLISGSLDKTARVWDMGQPKPDASSAKDGAALVLAGHTAAIGGVTFSPDGQWAATASFDGTVRVFELGQVKGEKRTLSAVVVLQGHSAEVHCIDWSPDGRWIATGSTDEAVRLWDAEKVKTEGRSGKGEPVSLKAERTVEGLGKQRILSVRFAPDSGRVLWTGGGLGGGTVCGLIDVATGTVNVRFTEHTNSVLHGSLAPDGQLAATADASGEILLWRTADGTRVRKLVGNARVTWAAAWSNDGNTVAWGNTNSGGGIKADAPLERAFDLSRLAFMEFKSQISDPKSQISNSKSDGGWRRAQFRLGSTTLESSGETTVDVLRSGTRQSTLQFEDDYSHKYNTVRSFTLLPGDRAAVGANYGLSLFDTRTGKRLRHFVGHTGVVRAVSPSPDNRYLLTASNDMTVRVWVPDQEQPLVSLFFAGDEWVAWTPEGYFVASPGGESLMGWHLNNGPDKLAPSSPPVVSAKNSISPI